MNRVFVQVCVILNVSIFMSSDKKHCKLSLNKNTRNDNCFSDEDISFNIISYLLLLLLLLLKNIVHCKIDI